MSEKRTQRLIQAFLLLDTEDEIQRFMRDLLTENEISEFAKRLEAARLLHSHVPYSQIKDTTGLSSTTIARISKWLKNGRGGYAKVFKRLSV